LSARAWFLAKKARILGTFTVCACVPDYWFDFTCSSTHVVLILYLSSLSLPFQILAHPTVSLLIFSPYLLSPLPVGADYNWLDLNIERDNTRWRSSVTFVAKKRPRCFAPLTRQPFVTLVTTVSIMPTSLLQSISVFPFSILPQKTSPSVISARFFFPIWLFDYSFLDKSFWG